MARFSPLYTLESRHNLKERERPRAAVVDPRHCLAVVLVLQLRWVRVVPLVVELVEAPGEDVVVNLPVVVPREIHVSGVCCITRAGGKEVLVDARSTGLHASPSTWISTITIGYSLSHKARIQRMLEALPRHHLLGRRNAVLAPPPSGTRCSLSVLQPSTVSLGTLGPGCSSAMSATQYVGGVCNAKDDAQPAIPLAPLVFQRPQPDCAPPLGPPQDPARRAKCATPLGNLRGVGHRRAKHVGAIDEKRWLAGAGRLHDEGLELRRHLFDHLAVGLGFPLVPVVRGDVPPFSARSG